ncbi:hypothetical protein BK022_20290 [Methylorubrum extorquens]|uniref:Uncharacterized protein n=1 Tax=Methylorubrum extorquens TaxID=408 RepID=A0A1S1NX21_METEX|nr:hypothetical protein BK022_20290 [Methylorubrum extorquens]
MSGALMQAPPSVETSLDLLRPSLPLPAQADFLHADCREHPEQDYMDAVHAMYRRLRGAGSEQVPGMNLPLATLAGGAPSLRNRFCSLAVPGHQGHTLGHRCAGPATAQEREETL